MKMYSYYQMKIRYFHCTWFDEMSYLKPLKGHDFFTAKKEIIKYTLK